MQPAALIRAEPLRGFDPCWMAEAVVVSEGRDTLGINLDPAGRRLELVCFRVGAKITQEIVMGGRRIGQEAFLPESFEIRALDAVPRRLLAGRLLGRSCAHPLRFPG